MLFLINRVKQQKRRENCLSVAFEQYLLYNKVMFKKLYRSIYLPIVLIAVALIAFIDVFSIIMITQTLSDAYSDIDRKRISRALDSCELYLSSVAVSTYNLSLNGVLIDELKNNTGKTLTALLDATCNYSLKINGVSVYSANGTVYTSSQVSGVPALDELREIDEIKNFLDGEETEALSFRTKNVADIYNNASYPDNMGVISYCKKVFDGGDVVGWIFADVLPVNFYNILFSNGQFENAVAFIQSKDLYFEYADNYARESLLTDGHKGYFKCSAASADGLYSITVFNGTREYNAQIAVLLTILISVSAALTIGVHFAAKLTAKSVTKRLDNLADKMNSQYVS